MKSSLRCTPSRQVAQMLRDLPASHFFDTCRLVQFVCSCPIAALNLLDDRHEYIKSHAGLGWGEFPLDHAWTHHVRQSEPGGQDHGLLEHERMGTHPLVLGAPQIRSVLGALLHTPDGTVVGSLCAYDVKERSFSPNEQEAIAALARQAEAQIEHAMALWALEQRRREDGLINSFGEMLQSCRDSSEINDVVAAYMKQLYPESSGLLGRIDRSRAQVHTCVRWGQIETIEVFGLHECWALRRGRMHPHRAGEVQLACEHVANAKQDYVCAPLVADGETLGVVQLIQDPGSLTDSRIESVRSCAERISLALANAELRDTLRDQSIRDPLTGLLNRRFLGERFEEEIRKCQRQQRPLSFLMLDIDFFKRFNDRFGHSGGDALLIAIGQHFSRSMRDEDIVCRYGGEEFAILLPGVSLPDAIVRAQELCESTRAMEVSDVRERLSCVTVSIGVSALGEHGSGSAEIIRAADRALFRAKESGRDQIAIAHSRSLRAV